MSDLLGREITVKRDVAAAVVPVGTRVTIHAGEAARVTQALGGSYTVVVNGNMFRIEGKDADALGLSVQTHKAPAPLVTEPKSQEEVDRLVWGALKTCYDPEIPVNIVDLGLIYDCHVEALGEGSTYRVAVKMTLTAPGCGMGPVIQQDVHNKILSIEDVDEVEVELVWDPLWNQGMMTDAAKLELGMM
jgi:probable FeS assembly SUF system protein SufT